MHPGKTPLFLDALYLSVYIAILSPTWVFWFVFFLYVRGSLYVALAPETM